MSGDRRVRFRILHIIEAAEFVRQTLDGMTLDDFSTNRVVVLATLHSLQIAGEAANALPSDFTEKHAGFPWLELRDMRNVIVHQYFGINPDIILDTVHNDFLPLEDELCESLASFPQRWAERCARTARSAQYNNQRVRAEHEHSDDR